MSIKDNSFELIIMYDDLCAKKSFLADFGFSVLIFNKFTHNFILFDTGSNGEILLHNLKKKNIDSTKIKKIIISHNHFDHTGGLNSILKHSPEAEVYVPHDDLVHFKRNFPGVKFHGISQHSELEKNVYSSGQLGDRIKEQALLLKTSDNKLIIIVGCTHPGLENFIIKAMKINDIKAIIGGFHGFNKYSYLKGIRYIGVCHCTMNIEPIRRKFPNNTKKICVGSVIHF